MKVGFIGLGSMGAGMSRNLLKAGHDLVVYNRTRSLAQEMRSLGAKVADSASEAAVGVEVLITMLADDRAVQDAIFEPGRAIESLPERAVHISMSTISVDLSRRLAKSHAGKRQNYIAAPVFGRPDAAAAGKLFIVSAGPSESIDKCRSLFGAMGQKAFTISEDAPAANLVKLSGNFLTTTVIESLTECFALMRKFGVDPRRFLEVLTESMFSAPVYKTYGGIIASEQFEPVGFKLSLGFKDNRLLLAAAEEAWVPMPMASLMHDRFVAALAQGLENADWSAIARVTYGNAGL
ncbi:MAG: NAD(P)-dependent oxidoreductase [Bryobacteraceae bacterium]|jgi:3-hydroxyisobutyrate dehydrogenase-like beta-hydroxyacid dehydrogenase